MNFDVVCPQRLSTGLSALSDETDKRQIVIISHSWQSQLKIAALLGPDGHIEKKELDIDDIKSGLIALKQQIGSRPLVVIGQVPGAGTDLYQHYTRTWLTKLITDEPDRRFNKPQPKRIQFNEDLKKIVSQIPNTHFIDPHDIFCDRQLCRNFDDSEQFIYSDHYHLSKFGSIFFFEEVKNQIIEIMNEKKSETL